MLKETKEPQELEGGKEEGSFTAKIRELESANHGLCSELDQTRVRLESSLDESRKLQAKNCALEWEVETTTSKMRHQGDEMKRLREVIILATQVLQSHHPQSRVVVREDNAEAESLEGSAFNLTKVMIIFRPLLFISNDIGPIACFGQPCIVPRCVFSL